MNDNSLFHYVDFSSKGDDWSSFGSLLSGLFTLAGSLATTATLLFLIKQDAENNKVRSEQIKSEREKSTFEKYKIHLEMFNDILNSIESRERSSISFINRTVLYRKIFPENNFNHCDTSIFLGDDPRVSMLVELSQTIGSIITRIKNKQYESESRYIFECLSAIHLALEIQSNNDLKNGDVYIDEGNIMFNAFYLDKYLNSIHLIIHELRLFAGSSGLPEISLNKFEIIDLKAWSVRASFMAPHSTDMVSDSSIRFYTGNQDFTNFMYSLGNLVKAHKYCNNKIITTYSWIMNFLMSTDKIKKITTGVDQEAIKAQLIEVLLTDKAKAEQSLEPFDIIEENIDFLQS